MKIRQIALKEAPCAVDLTCGSERGGYVSQDYILNKLKRPHRAINLMYCYYPLDEGWPLRASVAHANPDISFAWDYPYDDYFPYTGGIGGNTEGEPFCFMRDIRAHGQDVILTLTIDPNVSNCHLVQIAKDLSVFGRLQLRINHEATGTWFSFNKRCTYQEVADFYVRFHNVVKDIAPHIKTVLCAGGISDDNTGQVEYEKEFTKAIRATDVWSLDRYIALNYGWPYKIAEPGGETHLRYSVESVYDFAKKSRERFIELNGGTVKPMVLSELNADGDVTGQVGQARTVAEFTQILKNDPDKWLSAFAFYQFRDKGRLGLEREDANNENIGIEQPIMETYKQIIHDPFFSPVIKTYDYTELPITLRWGGLEDSTGIALELIFEKNPVFCEINFDLSDKLNLIMELNGRWFYKSPGAVTIDLMPAFYDKPLNGQTTLNLNIYAPPANGENDPSQGSDWCINYYTKIISPPIMRIRYEPTASGPYKP